MKLVVIEDSQLILNELLDRLSMEPRIELAGTAADEEGAVRLILGARVDAVLLDLSLSPGSGLRVLKRIRAARCGARVLILTSHTSDEVREACVKAGANGFFDKTSEVDACIRQLLAWLPAPTGNETSRIRKLHSLGLLDSPGHVVFDNITRLAADIAETPIALISLVDENRQWFLSRTGTELHETSRSVSFCAHTILSNQMLVVEDALADERFRDNPLVRGQEQIRFYAGVPLLLSSGEALGSLCVIDTKPRQLTDRQREALRTLGASAVAEIELRRRVVELESEAERRRIAESNVLHLATRDPLTNLPNRATFRDRLSQHTLLAKRSRQLFAVLFIDLDHFKPINDTLGHDAGDEALVTVANRLNDRLRESDTISRLGGDEFGVLLTGVHSEIEAQQVADILINTLAAPIKMKGHTLYIGASVGIAMYPDHGETGEQLLTHADLAMYEAKKAGSNLSIVYSNSLSERDDEAKALAIELQDAIAAKHLVLHFQPQVALNTLKLCGVEALVRWNHPQRGLLPPSRFVHLAEKRGLMNEMTRLVLDMAVRQVRQWDDMGIHVPRISVNISAVDVRRELLRTVQTCLQAHDLAPERLELEITESMLTSDGVDTMNVLSQLRKMGISIAVDDFGIGYSSLSQIHHLPVDCLKIDRSFVVELVKSEVDVAIVKAILTMANALELRTIAEGVESNAHVDILTELGCGCAQGYLISRPVAADAFAQWHAEYVCSAEQTLNGGLLD